MKTFVISNVHRPALVLPHIQEFNPIVSLTPDYPYHCIGHFRCFHGHTNALFAHGVDLGTEPVLVFEDDCVPVPGSPWREQIEAGKQLLIEGGYDLVCLHGRSCDWSRFKKFLFCGWPVLEPDFDTMPAGQWESMTQGTLAYIITPSMARRFINADFWLHGTNIDCWLWTRHHKFCIMEPNNFIHDRSQGSILENPRNVENVVR